jgi:hypothetical protein
MVAPGSLLLSDLVRAVSTPSSELQFLKRYWAKVSGPLKKERELLWSRLTPDDPIRQSCDLLSPLRSAGDEVLHTLALSYLIDPEKPHGLRGTSIRQLLLALKRLSKKHQSIITSLMTPAKFWSFLSDGIFLLIPALLEFRGRTFGSRSPAGRGDDLW